MTQAVSLRGEQLLLLPERALWWPAQRAIIISDLHWGKTAHFRKNGIAMPVGTQQRDAARLAQIIRSYEARQLIIAGDLFHSRHNQEVEDFRHWRDAHEDLDIHFIMGNHDILPAAFYESLVFTVHREGLESGPFYISHDDVSHQTLYTIHGHVHPGIPLTGPGTSSRSMPCFCIDEHRMILPAFGKFTGCKRIEPSDYRHIYVVGDNKVMQLK